MFKNKLLNEMMEVFEENCQQVINDCPERIEDFEMYFEGSPYYGALGLRIYLEDLANEVLVMYNPDGELIKLFDDAACDYLNKLMKGLLK